MNTELSNLDRLFLEKAIKDTPTLKVGVSVPKSMNKGFSDLPLFEQKSRQTDLFTSANESNGDRK